MKAMPPDGSRSPTLIAALTLLAPISWGTTYVTITELLPPERPVLVTALRTLPAGIALAAFAAARARWRPRGWQWLHLVTLAVFNFGLFFPLLVAAVYRLPGGVAASVGGIQPLLVAAATWLIRGERPRVRDMAIAVIAALGVALVVIRPGSDMDAVGVVAALGANASFSVGVVLTKTLPTPEHRTGATGWQLVIASVVIVPIALVFEGLPPKLTATNAVGFAYLSLVATGGAFALWFNGIRRLPTQAPPILGLAAPITGAALGWIILNEDLTIAQIVGFAITAAAITYAATIGARPTTTRNHCVQRLPTPDTALRRDATPCQPAPQATCGPAPTCR